MKKGFLIIILAIVITAVVITAVVMVASETYSHSFSTKNEAMDDFFRNYQFNHEGAEYIVIKDLSDEYSAFISQNGGEKLSYIVLNKGIFGWKVNYADVHFKDSNKELVPGEIIYGSIKNHTNVESVTVNDSLGTIKTLTKRTIWYYTFEDTSGYEDILVDLKDEGHNSIEQYRIENR